MKFKIILLVIFFAFQSFLISQTGDGDTVWTRELGVSIGDIKYHPSGDFIAAIGEGNIFIIDAKNGEILKQINVNGINFYTLALSPSGDTIVTGDSKGYIRLWNFYTGDSLAIIDDYYTLENYNISLWPPYVNDVEFSPDGDYLITCGAYAYNSGGQTKGAVIIHELKQNKIVKTTIEPVKSCLAVSPKGDYFATATLYEQTVELWQTSNWEKVKVLGTHTSDIYAMDFSNSGNYLISGGGLKRLWSIPEGKIIKDFNNCNIIKSLKFRDDDKFFLVGEGYSDSIYLNIYEFETGKISKSYNYRKYFNWNAPYYISISSDNNYFASRSPNGIMLWRAKWEGDGINDEFNENKCSIIPNPVENQINIGFYIEKYGMAEIKIMNNEGIAIANVCQKLYEPGEYIEIYKIDNIPSGLYYCKISTSTYTATIKFIVNK